MAQQLVRQEAMEIATAKGYGLDPATIAVIIQAILAAMQLIQQCRESQTKLPWRDLRKIGATKIGFNRVHRAVERHIGTYWMRQFGGSDFTRHLVEVGENRSVKHLDLLLKEVANDAA